jgi:hypothetical protein
LALASVLVLVLVLVEALEHVLELAIVRVD